MSPAPSGSLALYRIELADALEIRDALIFNFYLGLPHIHTYIPAFLNATNDLPVPPL